MRIVHIIDSMDLGGAEMLVSQLCHSQRELGHDPSVCVINRLGVLGEQMQSNGFQIRENLGRHLFDSSRNFYRVFRALQPDVVHLHNPTSTIYAAPAARMLGVPSIISTRHSLMAAPHRKVEELKYAAAAACCDWIACVCDAALSNLKSMHRIRSEKIVRIYNGAESPVAMLPEKPLEKTGFTLLYVGRLVPIKNHSLLLHAFHNALLRMPNLRLWVVGDGSERAALEGLSFELDMAGRVMFWGQQLDVAQFFSAADGFIMSSRSEGLPISLLQAFSHRLPVIVTDVGGMAEAVSLTEAGIVVKADDVEEMSAAIVRLASNDLARLRFASHAEMGFRRLFTLEKMADAYMELYMNTCRQRRNLVTSGNR